MDGLNGIVVSKMRERGRKRGGYNSRRVGKSAASSTAGACKHSHRLTKVSNRRARAVRYFRNFAQI